ncbi:ABC transporter permease [bacterium]|nr:ABC transporter permease [bacterium]
MAVRLKSLASRNIVLLNILRVFSLCLKALISGRIDKKEFQKQLYDFSIGSLGIVVFCLSFVGVIITLEYSFHMKLVIGDDSLIPSFAMVMLTRELAPIVTALLITSKMGAAMAAEIGAMKNTEQLDAYRLLSLQPIELFVAPRFVASALATFMLAMIALGVSIAGTWLSSITFLNFSSSSFFNSLFVFTKTSDFVSCGVKALLFGASIPVISSTYGFRCRFGAEGVGEATTNAVVTNSIWIIILDFILTYAFSLSA